MIQVDDAIEIISHSHLFHVRQLTQAVSGFDAFHKVLLTFLGKGVQQIYATQAWSAARMSREATMPTSGTVTGCASTPSQSQETLMFLMTLI